MQVGRERQRQGRRDNRGRSKCKPRPGPSAWNRSADEGQSVSPPYDARTNSKPERRAFAHESLKEARGGCCWALLFSGHPSGLGAPRSEPAVWVLLGWADVYKYLDTCGTALGLGER